MNTVSTSPGNAGRRRVLAVLATCAVFLIGSPFARAVPTGANWWSDGSWLLISLAAGIACARTSRRVENPRARVGWRWLSIGCLCWFAGATWWAFGELVLGRYTPFPSGADAFFLGIAPAFLLGALQLRRAGQPALYSLSLVADIGMVAVAIALVTAMMLREPLSVTTGSGLYVGLAVAYTVSSSSAFVVVLLWSLGSGGSRALGWIALALGFFAFVNLIYCMQLLTGGYQTGAWLDVMWVAPFACVIAGAHVYPTGAARVSSSLPARIDVVAAPALIILLIVVAVAFTERWDGPVRLLVIMAGMLMGGFFGLRALAAHRFERAFLDEAQRRSERERTLDAQLATIQQHKAIGTLAAGISHDFNNLLQAMSGQLTLARRYAARGEDPRPAIEDAERALARASELSARLLGVGRPVDADVVAVDPTALVQQVAGLLRTAVGHEVQVKVQAPPSMTAVVRAVRSEMELALLNLGLNARDALGPRGGTIEFALSEQAGEVVFTVTDDCAGMSPDVAARALEPFFTTKPPGQGAGLGLTFVSSFASRNAGMVHIDGRPGVGARIALRLPAAGDAAAASAQPMTAVSGSVLLIIGSGASDLAIRGALERAGYDVIFVASVDVGAAIIASGEPLVAVVVDVAQLDGDASWWPALSGPHVARHVALAASAIAIPATFRVLAKPVTPAAVVDAIVPHVSALPATPAATTN